MGLENFASTVNGSPDPSIGNESLHRLHYHSCQMRVMNLPRKILVVIIITTKNTLSIQKLTLYFLVSHTMKHGSFSIKYSETFRRFYQIRLRLDLT